MTDAIIVSTVDDLLDIKSTSEVFTIAALSPVVFDIQAVENISKIETFVTQASLITEGAQGPAGPKGNLEETFETVSKNLKAVSFTMIKVAGVLNSIVYANGITKQFQYSDGVLSSVTLSGATPQGITLTKHFNYSADSITVSYN